MPNNEPKPNVIWHQSGVNLQGEPFIQLLHNTEIIGQMTPQEAREHAQAILEAAEAAEQDAFLWDFAKNKLGSDTEHRYALIVEFRKYRAERTGKSQGPTRPTDWIMPKPDHQD